METKLTKKEAQNWLKCMFATYTTRDVIAQLADLGFKLFYSHVRSDMRSKLGIVETQTCSRCNNISKQCHLCSEIGIRIWDNHRFKKASLKGPSWSNTDSTKWCVDPWELAKCYMPPTGYRDKPNAESTDFNGIIGAIYNCTWMQCYFADDLNKDSNICAEAREEVNKLRHLQDTNIDDGAMISFFDCLLNLLNDPGHLHSLKPAVDARLYLKQLQQDTLQLSEKAVNSTLNKLYEDQKEEFRERLIELYSTTKKTVSVSPLREGLDKPIGDVYVKPKMSHVTIDKDGSRKKTDNAVHQYKDLFYTDKKLNSRVFIQGEPGVGKTTFLTKLALDWCDAVSVHNPDHKATFIDVDTLMEFQFLFYISLRDANDQREVTEMIKIQIIDMIYTGDKREEVVKLLSQIMEQETCLITMDGLNEWVDPLNKCVIPLLVPCHTKSVSVITSRSWKMADERIKDSEIKNLIEIEGIIDSEDLSKKIINSLQTSNVKTHTEFIVYVHERRLWHLFTSPWLQTLLVNLWMNNMPVSGSLCEINCILIDMLFKNAHAKKGYFKKGNSFRCLLNTRFIHQQINIFDALANAAFQFTFSSNKSLVFTERELLNYMTEDQLSFCLNAGVLTQRYSSAVPYQFSFIHETVQEFMAAYHIANSKNDLITHFRSGAKYYVLQISQTIIYLCGLNCEKANKLIKQLEDDDLQNSINHGLSEYVKGIYPQIFFGIDDEDLTDNDSFCLALAALFQDMIIAGYIEAKTNGEKNICLNCTDFIFNPYLNESNSTALKLLLLANNSNVRSLILESNVLKTSEIITIIQKSRHCLKRVRMAGNPETNKALYQTSIQELQISGEFDAPSLPGVSTEKIIYRRCPSLSQLAYLTLSYCTLSKDIVLPDTIHSITLVHCSCSSAFLQRLLVRLSYLKPYVHVVLVNMDVTDSETHQFQRELLSSDLTNIHLNVVYASRDLCKLIQCTSIGILGISGLDTAGSDSSVLEIVHTLNRLSELRLCGTNTGRCDLKLPASLQSIILRDVECSTEWLCSLLITLSSFDHPVTCEMWEVVLKSSEQIHGEESLTHISDLRSEILSLELSNIQLRVVTGSKELFEILRDTSIDILYLRTADCVSLASEILHTLNKLTNLLLWGTYTGRCDLRFPASLKYITLQEGDYSSDWLCSLLITLSSFDHPVTCNLLGNVLESSEETRGEESLTHISDLRSEILSLDLSKIGLSVETGSKELFEILRDTSIDILYLRTADCVSLASEILHTLNKLTKLFLWGTYTGRCDLRLPASLKYISLQEGIYSSDWLCSLLITLSSFDHPVKCHLLGNVLELSEETCEEESLTHISDLRAEILSRDLSNITISVETGSKELYEILRYTSIDILDLLTADWVSLASEILHTLNRLTKLFCGGPIRVDVISDFLLHWSI
ncbi:uncharacterized protein LOC127848376 isoform X1 [Dreissena polymorpha]|uniref:NACHT domain-containing protein n=1 Tax=Dreissena polymorpha TaxID=45954 RepID=A0A9D4I6A5_DREPO|nr:uncharacterized protein LOC127848376 isoform X1 [Dreissena polymorpha]KAH3748152.1 hypothetical protein DPMN_182589 [Dreissena polymorpha]